MCVKKRASVGVLVNVHVFYAWALGTAIISTCLGISFIPAASVAWPNTNL